MLKSMCVRGAAILCIHADGARPRRLPSDPSPNFPVSLPLFVVSDIALLPQSVAAGMGSQTMKASASQQGPLSAPVFSLGEPNKHLTGASGGKRARQREVPLPDEEVVTETQSEPDSGRIW